jgi:hypothetical protein
VHLESAALSVDEEEQSLDITMEQILFGVDIH